MENLKQWSSQLKNQLHGVLIAMHREDTPLYAKIACLLCVGYALSPIDLIPDFIPVLGYIDDIIVLPCLVWLCIKLIPTNILQECMEESQQSYPKKWYYALPAIVIWVLIGFWLYHIFAK